MISVYLEGAGKKCPPHTAFDAFERIRMVGLTHATTFNHFLHHKHAWSHDFHVSLPVYISFLNLKKRGSLGRFLCKFFRSILCSWFALQVASFIFSVYQETWFKKWQQLYFIPNQWELKFLVGLFNHSIIDIEWDSCAAVSFMIFLCVHSFI